jgi:hypothetical protein
MALVKLIRLNEAFNENGEIHVNPLQLVAVIGEDTAPNVRVVTTGGSFDVAQPQGEGTTSVRAQLSA